MLSALDCFVTTSLVIRASGPQSNTFLDAIPQGTRSLLDIGCGIGLSSHTFARARTDLAIVGIDISPRNIEIAQRLFEEPNLTFRVGDLHDPVAGSPFDVISLIDVYEHIPPDRRDQLHHILSSSLAARGVVVLTCPTPLHQAYLRQQQPEGLQIVDEDITIDHVSRLANDLGASVIHYNIIPMWRRNQYFHAVMERSPSHDRVPPPKRRPISFAKRIVSRLRGGLPEQPEAESVEQRRQRVKQRLGMVVE